MRTDWRKAEHGLSEAYLRLRRMIPGALDTPYAPTKEMVWRVTEEALAKLVRANETRRSTS
jgi:hypothetical protein